MSKMKGNPFAGADAARAAIWEMLVARDIKAFVRADWTLVEADFISSGFFGVAGEGERDPDRWRLRFPSLEAYKAQWLESAQETMRSGEPASLELDIRQATKLDDIDIKGNVAVAHKKFDGYVRLKDGDRKLLHMQTLYFCRCVDGAWRIASFVGYLPLAF